MKKNRLIQILLLAAYCVPYAFLAVYGDAFSGSLLFYGVMAVVMAVLFRVTLGTGNKTILLAGNAISLLCSLAAAEWSGMGAMGEYFKPLTAYSLMALLSAAAFLFQMAALVIINRRKKTAR